MSNPLVTVLCFTALCFQLEGKPNWAAPILFVAAAIAIWNNVQWSKVFKAVAKLMAARK